MTIETTTLEDQVSGLIDCIKTASEVDLIHKQGDPDIDLKDYRENRINYLVLSPISDEPEHEAETTEEQVLEIEMEIDQYKTVSRMLTLQVTAFTELAANPHARAIIERFVAKLDSDDINDALFEAGFALQGVGPIIELEPDKEDWQQAICAVELELNYETSTKERMNVIEVLELTISSSEDTQTLTLDTEEEPWM